MDVARTAPTVYLHIGTPKSGTTYLQSRMAGNAAAAAEQGLLWPGPGWGPHVEAARELRRLRPGRKLAPHGAWARLVKEVRGWTGPRALISMEWMIECTAEQITAALESLQPCRVEVVVTARDLLRTFTAQWQEMTKNYRPWTWEQFVTDVRDEVPDSPSRDTFWRQQDLPVILRRWAEQVPADRIHLVTVPRAGDDPELLWQRYCTVLGIDGSAFAPPRDDNASLGVVSSVLMQRLNVVAHEQQVPYDVYKRVVHRQIGRRLLTRWRSAEGPIAVSPETDAWIRRRSKAMLDEVATIGVDVVGDPDELVPGEPLKGREPSEVDERELLDLCLDTLVRLGVQRDQEFERLRRRSGPGEPPGRASMPRRGARRIRRALGRLRRTLRRSGR